jgi:molybdopterin synthase catalytic subunit
VIRVQTEDFDVGAELEALGRGHRNVGAVASFVGLVRDLSEDDSVSALVLEHYPGMTERQLEKIEVEARARWPLDEVLIIHRHGRLEPGERIVLCAATSAHRQAALEACAFLIDWLKTEAPFWKLEDTEDGERWVEGRDSDDQRAARWRR